ncbi:hypothetical protein JG688_00011540 [Phytophthora aleatoria]|uniref:Retrotransposon gag domain-containing protein n=1 Tax=Phytophthora aleatoria TaxID=2496075 RepID=A0A8J5J467_9STRA|nr:hypothetical protein JG688_00011540 [Phytophthora aleatoria]
MAAVPPEASAARQTTTQRPRRVDQQYVGTAPQVATASGGRAVAAVSVPAPSTTMTAQAPTMAPTVTQPTQPTLPPTTNAPTSRQLTEAPMPLERELAALLADTARPVAARPPTPVTWGTTTTAASARATRAASPQRYPGPDDSGDSSDDSSYCDSSDDEGSSSDDEPRRGRAWRDDDQREPRIDEVERPRERRNRRRSNVKELTLAPYKPSPTVLVSIWIAKVDLALEGARLSGRGDWTDAELYYILGNKRQDNAAQWWIQMDRKLHRRQKTWTKSKVAFLRRYGGRPEEALAEWRVYQRRMYPGETYADFAAGLRDVIGQNHVRERVLLSQFYQCLDKTTRMLVKQQDPPPATLEEAVDKATEVSDPIDNVAQGMQNIGQPWATALNQYMVSMEGTVGNVTVMPGVGSGMGVANGQDVAAGGQEGEMMAQQQRTPQGQGAHGTPSDGRQRRVRGGRDLTSSEEEEPSGRQ